MPETIATRTIGEALESLPTITTGHMHDLKAETDRVRVWLSRMTPQDGADPADAVAVEVLATCGGWVDLASLPVDVPVAFLRSAFLAHCGLRAELAGDLARIITHEIRRRTRADHERQHPTR